jgi:uncharacterized repeat protein (TIGR02543 family)
MSKQRFLLNSIVLVSMVLNLFWVPVLAAPMRATTITFTAQELLGKPEDTSITVNIVPASAIVYHYEYGTSSNSYSGQTTDVTASAGNPSEVVISGLQPNTQYFYRMQYHIPTETDWVTRDEHSFWTQRAQGSSFSFTVTADSHENFNTAEQNAVTNIANEHPDFNIDLGDTFLLDGLTSQSAVNTHYLNYRQPQYFDKIGNSTPIFLVSGNHEDEEGWNLDDTPFSIAVGSVQARKLYYPTPINDGFYSGNIDPLSYITDTTKYGDKLREDYYAWTWGDALFVVIDEYQYTMHNPYGSTAGEGSDDPKTCDDPNDPNCQWNWTLGTQQYQWFKQTLENSQAKYKFVFSHHMLGGKLQAESGTPAGYVRGGCGGAPYFEWGGKNADGTDGFAAHRSATYGADAKPIRQLMMENGVSAYFHGHDHQYVYETCDGMVYQEVPSPGMSGSGFNVYTQGDHGSYNTVKVLPNSGHLRITVTPAQATVDYVSSGNYSTNGTINYSYTITPNTSGPTHTLTTALSPSAGGTISPAAGDHTYAEDTVVDITATPNAGYTFSTWSGDCSGSGACQVTMDADKSVTANFTAVPTHVLTTAVSPSGGGAINPAAGDHTYNQGDVVTISATPNSGYTFSGWSGACTGTGSCSVTMDADKTVTATFSATSATVTFTGAELLGRPEANSISISVVPDSAISLYYEYGTTSGVYTGQTDTTTAAAGTPKVVTINGLTANTKYYYRMQYSTDGGSTWTARSAHTFQTQRAEGSTFTFDVTSDSHIDIMLGNESNWTSTLNDVASDAPDFLIDLGDTFAMDNGSTSVTLGDTATAEQKYKDQLPFFNLVSASSPIYVVAGNHEQQEAWHLTASNTGGDPAISLPVMGKNAEKKYFLNPVNDSFYSGDTTTYSYLSGDQLKQDYFAWTWGDALFVVISPYWTTTTKPYTTSTGGGETDTTGSGNRWDWTLGLDQFNWLKTTLQNSTAKYKFVFAHQIVGGNSMTNQMNYGHGGGDSANFVEWGGYNTDGTTYTWETNRPGWGSQPIRQMMEANGVTAFFHGHDHQFAYESLNDMVYQAVPSSSFTGTFGNYTTGGNSGKTIWADSTQGPGHLKVTVGPSQTTVDFIRYNATSPAYSYNMAPASEPVPGSVTLDGTVSSGVITGTSISVAHTTGTGTDRLMLVGVSWNCYNTARTISSVTFTYGSTTLTLNPVITQQAGTQLRHAAIYSLLNPPSGVSGTVTVTFSGSVSNGIVVGVANFAGVDQTTPLGLPNGAGSGSNDNAPSVTLTGLNGNELVFDTVFQGASGSSQTLTAGPGQTQLWNSYISNTRAAGSTEQAIAASVTMSWTAASASYWAIAAVPINPAPTGTTHDLTIAKVGTGSGTVTPDVGVHSYAEGTVVTLEATADTGSTFEGWSGDADCADGSVTMSADKTCTATFTLLSPSGSATSSAIPSNATPSIGQQIVVTISIDVSGVNLPDNALGSFTGSLDWNPSVLTYNSNSGLLAGFTGAVNVSQVSSGHIVFNGANASGATGNVTILRITFDVVGTGSSDLNLEYSAMAAAVTFGNLLPILTVSDGYVEVSQPEYTLNYAAGAGGSLTGNTSQTVNYGEDGTAVTAVPNTGYHFVNWSDGSTANPRTDTHVTANVNVTATFAQVPNPVPMITSLSPTTITVGSPDFVLTVNGTNFINISVVQWNGTSLTTTFVSSERLLATVPASNITAAGAISITVVNPAPGGGVSNVLFFTVVIRPATIGDYKLYLPLVANNRVAPDLAVERIQAASNAARVVTPTSVNQTWDDKHSTQDIAWGVWPRQPRR